MQTVWQDLRYGARSLTRYPGFALVAILTLAVGIGANTAIFSVVNAMLLRPFPFLQPERLMRVSLVLPPVGPRPANDDMVWSYPKFQTFRDAQQVFERVALYQGITYNLTGVEQAERLQAERVTSDYFPILGVQATAGRVFSPNDDPAPGAPRIVLLGHGLWQRLYGGDSGVVGRRMQLDGTSYEIAGVLPEGFRGLTGTADAWIPLLTESAESLGERWNHSYQCIARLRSGITPEAAGSAMTLLGAVVDKAHPDSIASGRALGARARTLNEARIDRDTRTAVLVLFAAVGFVLLIACANVANLLLARAGVREREIGIRMALGASRARLIRQLLTESVLLAILGAAAGLALAQWGVSALNAAGPVPAGAGARRIPGLMLIGLSSIRIDPMVLLFTLGATVVTGILFGLAPAWNAAGRSMRTAMETANPRLRVSGSALVVAEIALALVLLVASGLMLKSFGRLLTTRAGVDAANVLTLRISLTGANSQPANSVTFFEDLQSRLAALPGVQSAGLTDCPPLAGGCNGTPIWFRDRPPVPRGAEPIVGVHWVSGDYFRTLRVPLVRGRWFTPDDRTGSPKVVVINETAARRFWPGEDPLGKPVAVGQGGFGDRAEIVGIVGDVRYGGLDEPPRPDVYLSYRQSPRPFGVVFLRTEADPLALVAAVRREIQGVDANLPLYDIKSLEERIRDATAKMRFFSTVIAVFGAVGLILAAVGIYGVMAYGVAQRTREIGVRIAIGAQPRDVVWLVVRQGLMLTAAGLLLGLAGALAATRALSSLLYQVKPTDPATYALFAAVLGGTAMLASYLPARRAARVDPVVALRTD